MYAQDASDQTRLTVPSNCILEKTLKARNYASFFNGFISLSFQDLSIEAPEERKCRPFLQAHHRTKFHLRRNRHAES